MRGVSHSVSVLLLLLIVLFPLGALSNDSAVEVAAGGIRLRGERRVSMLKERLYIAQLAGAEGRFRVRVEYEFINETGSDVVTEVAFPVPEYQYEYLGPTYRFDDFRLWVDGERVRYKKNVRALHQGKDVTTLLRGMGLDIEKFGYFDVDDDQDHPKYQAKALSGESIAKLVQMGLVGGGKDRWPQWRVAVMYHWTQRFPPGKIIKVRHEYTPAPGHGIQGPEDIAKALPDGCFDKSISQLAGKTIWLHWVKYILTTANTWRTPIRDFELTVERPEGSQVSFCWDGKVERISEARFRARAKNFVPRRELTVYFYSVKSVE